MVGCSYAVLMSARPASNATSPISETEITHAVAAVSDVGREFGLDPSTELVSFQEVGAERGHRVLAVYGRAGDRETDWSKIFLIAYVDENGQFVVLLRDWSSLRATQFIQSLQEHLVADLSAALPKCRIEVRRLHDMAVFYVP
jgi:hypothetical protein